MVFEIMKEVGFFYQVGSISGGTILTSPLFIYAILPFVLIFTVLFAILQKTEILGKGKRQIDAITSLVSALIVVSFANAVNIIVTLLPFLAVSVVIILIFLILLGTVFKEGEFEVHKGLKIGMGIIVGIAVVVAVLLTTGAWDFIRNEWLLAGDGNTVITNIIFIVIVIAAIVTVVWGGGKKENNK